MLINKIQEGKKNQKEESISLNEIIKHVDAPKYAAHTYTRYVGISTYKHMRINVLIRITTTGDMSLRGSYLIARFIYNLFCDDD